MFFALVWSTYILGKHLAGYHEIPKNMHGDSATANANGSESATEREGQRRAIVGGFQPCRCWPLRKAIEAETEHAPESGTTVSSFCQPHRASLRQGQRESGLHGSVAPAPAPKSSYFYCCPPGAYMLLLCCLAKGVGLAGRLMAC